MTNVEVITLSVAEQALDVLRKYLVQRPPTVPSPPNLEELKKIQDPVHRGAAATAYIDARLDAIKKARQVRDDAIRVFLDAGNGPSAAATAFGVSVSHVKGLRR